MSELNLYQTEQTAGDGSVARFVYDPEADLLEIFFGENQPATGVELTDDIILRLNRQTHQPPQPDVAALLDSDGTNRVRPAQPSLKRALERIG